MKKLTGIFLIAGLMLLLAACGKKEGADQAVKDVSLEDIHTKVKEAYGENYIPNMPYDEEAMKNTIGVDPELFEEYIAEAPMISANVDTFIAIKAKAGKAKDVEKALTAYQDRLKNDSMQYPMNQIKIEASRVVSYGDYVFFVMLGFLSPEEEEKEEAEVLKAYEAQNQIAIDAMESLLLE